MTSALLLAALLAATDAPVVDAAQAPHAGEPSPFVCPVYGRTTGEAPPDYPAAPDARCVAEGSMAVLYGPDGQPLQRMTRVGPGWYLTAEGYRLADEAFRQVQRERTACRHELAGRPVEVPLPGVPVAPPVVAAKGSVSLPVALAVGVVAVLAAGYGGCRAAGGCR